MSNATLVPLLPSSTVSASCSGQFIDSAYSSVIVVDNHLELWSAAGDELHCQSRTRLNASIDLCIAVPLEHLYPANVINGKHAVLVLSNTGQWTLLCFNSTQNLFIPIASGVVQCCSQLGSIYQSEKRIPSSVITINPKSKKSKHVLAVFSLWRGVLSALEFCSSVDLNDPFPAQLEQPTIIHRYIEFDVSFDDSALAASSAVNSDPLVSRFAAATSWSNQMEGHDGQHPSATASTQTTTAAISRPSIVDMTFVTPPASADLEGRPTLCMLCAEKIDGGGVSSSRNELCAPIYNESLLDSNSLVMNLRTVVLDLSHQPLLKPGPFVISNIDPAAQWLIALPNSRILIPCSTEVLTFSLISKEKSQFKWTFAPVSAWAYVHPQQLFLAAAPWHHTSIWFGTQDGALIAVNIMQQSDTAASNDSFTLTELVPSPQIPLPSPSFLCVLPVDAPSAASLSHSISSVASISRVASTSSSALLLWLSDQGSSALLKTDFPATVSFSTGSSSSTSSVKMPLLPARLATPSVSTRTTALSANKIGAGPIPASTASVLRTIYEAFVQNAVRLTILNPWFIESIAPISDAIWFRPFQSEISESRYDRLNVDRSTWSPLPCPPKLLISAGELRCARLLVAQFGLGLRIKFISKQIIEHAPTFVPLQNSPHDAVASFVVASYRLHRRSLIFQVAPTFGTPIDWPGFECDDCTLFVVALTSEVFLQVTGKSVLIVHPKLGRLSAWSPQFDAPKSALADSFDQFTASERCVVDPEFQSVFPSLTDLDQPCISSVAVSIARQQVVLACSNQLTLLSITNESSLVGSSQRMSLQLSEISSSKLSASVSALCLPWYDSSVFTSTSAAAFSDNRRSVAFASDWNSTIYILQRPSLAVLAQTTISASVGGISSLLHVPSNQHEGLLLACTQDGHILYLQHQYQAPIHSLTLVRVSRIGMGSCLLRYLRPPAWPGTQGLPFEILATSAGATMLHDPLADGFMSAVGAGSGSGVAIITANTDDATDSLDVKHVHLPASIQPMSPNSLISLCMKNSADQEASILGLTSNQRMCVASLDRSARLRYNSYSTGGHTVSKLEYHAPSNCVLVASRDADGKEWIRALSFDSPSSLRHSNSDWKPLSSSREKCSSIDIEHISASFGRIANEVWRAPVHAGCSLVTLNVAPLLRLRESTDFTQFVITASSAVTPSNPSQINISSIACSSSVFGETLSFSLSTVGSLSLPTRSISNVTVCGSDHNLLAVASMNQISIYQLVVNTIDSQLSISIQPLVVTETPCGGILTSISAFSLNSIQCPASALLNLKFDSSPAATVQLLSNHTQTTLHSTFGSQTDKPLTAFLGHTFGSGSSMCMFVLASTKDGLHSVRPVWSDRETVGLCSASTIVSNFGSASIIACDASLNKLTVFKQENNQMSIANQLRCDSRVVKMMSTSGPLLLLCEDGSLRALLPSTMVPESIRSALLSLSTLLSQAESPSIRAPGIGAFGADIQNPAALPGCNGVDVSELCQAFANLTGDQRKVVLSQVSASAEQISALTEWLTSTTSVQWERELANAFA